jgi:hypothetical protein
MSEFLRIFQTRRDYCQALLELSREQSELIATDDYTQLLVLLGRKQRVLGRMEELSRRQPQLWQRWKGERDQLDPPTRAACEASLADAEAILGELNRLEQTSTEHLARRRDETRRQLESLSQGVRVHDAYRDPYAVPHRRLDVGR